MFDLASKLESLLPKAIAWAEAQSAEVASNGIALPMRCMEIARRVGVARPEKARVALVPGLPLPEDTDLKEAALETGLLGPNMAGLTLGHSVFVCHGHDSERLLAHEFRHVFQYEQAGSIAVFLPAYLNQIVQYGYAQCPLEIDARLHEPPGDRVT